MSPILYMQDYSPPVRSVLLTAAALNLKLQHKIIDISKQEQLTEEYIKLNPQHTIPTLDDNGTIIWDSHAINAYLVGKYGKDDSLYPKDLTKRALVDQRLHFDSGVIFSWLRYIARDMKFKGRTALTPDQVEAVEDGYQHLNNFLKDSQWVAGDSVTIADFSLITNIMSLHFLHPVDDTKYPNVVKWMKRAENLPYFEVNKKGHEDLKTVFKNYGCQTRK